LPFYNVIPPSSAFTSDKPLSFHATKGLQGIAKLIALISFTALAGCTTYTWPDGSQKTVLGVPAEEENSRYEDDKPKAIEYRLPGEIPSQQDEQE